MADLKKIAEEISELSLLEASELVEMLEEKLGVSAAAPMAMAAMPVAAAAAEPEEEQTEFDVILKEIGPRTWSTARPAPCWKPSPRRPPRTPSPRSRPLARSSRSSSSAFASTQ
jgi:hypothetical protein